MFERNVKKEVICCQNCGRDTTAVAGYCQKCMANSPRAGINNTHSYKTDSDNYSEESKA